MNLLIRYYSLKGVHLLLGIIIANIIVLWLSKTLLINEVVFYNAFSEQLTYDRAIKLFHEMKQYLWISYALMPILMVLKYSLISIALYIGIVLFNLQTKIPFRSVFKVVVASDIIFVLAAVLKFFWFYLFAGNYDMNDLSFFYPLSLINFFKLGEVAKCWIYPMQTINLFHLTYFLLISIGLNKTCAIRKADSDKIVLYSYTPALVLWIVLVLFLTIDVTT
jgi:hypothetical protein